MLLQNQIRPLTKVYRAIGADEWAGVIAGLPHPDTNPKNRAPIQLVPVITFQKDLTGAWSYRNNEVSVNFLFSRDTDVPEIDDHSLTELVDLVNRDTRALLKARAEARMAAQAMVPAVAGVSLSGVTADEITDF